MKTIYTAIFSNYDQLKEPRIVTPGWQYICFTDQPLRSKVWKIIHREGLPEGPQRTARFYKIMYQRHIETDHSIWIDASFLINCNLDQWWNEHYGKPFTCLNHPFRDCVYEEGEACLEKGNDSPILIHRQLMNYRQNGVPEKNGVIASGILMRDMSQRVIDLCDIWYQQIQLYSVRDQISFAYASMRMPVHHVIEWDYRKAEEFIYLKHKQKNKR